MFEVDKGRFPVRQCEPCSHPPRYQQFRVFQHAARVFCNFHVGCLFILSLGCYGINTMPLFPSKHDEMILQPAELPPIHIGRSCTRFFQRFREMSSCVNRRNIISA